MRQIKAIMDGVDNSLSFCNELHTCIHMYKYKSRDGSTKKDANKDSRDRIVHNASIRVFQATLFL